MGAFDTPSAMLHGVARCGECGSLVSTDVHGPHESRT